MANYPSQPQAWFYPNRYHRNSKAMSKVVLRPPPDTFPVIPGLRSTWLADYLYSTNITGLPVVTYSHPSSPVHFGHWVCQYFYLIFTYELVGKLYPKKVHGFDRNVYDYWSVIELSVKELLNQNMGIQWSKISVKTTKLSPTKLYLTIKLKVPIWRPHGQKNWRPWFGWPPARNFQNPPLEITKTRIENIDPYITWFDYICCISTVIPTTIHNLNLNSCINTR